MNHALIIAAHGSSVNPSSVQSVFELVERLTERPDIRDRFDLVEARFLAQAPRLEEVDWDELDATVVPFFMADGYFVREVLPRHVPTAAHITAPLGAIDLSHVVSSYMRSTCAANRLLIVGHGTSRHPDSGASVIALAESLQADVESVDVAFIDQKPSLLEVWTALQHDEIVVVPYFAIPGPHVTGDIPTILGLPSKQPGAYDVNGRTIWYAPAVGTMAGIADVVAELSLGGDRATG